MGVSIKKKNPGDPIVKSRRVFKNAADARLQHKMEGKNTPFQRRLRQAEAAGEKEFMWKGKPIAARTTALPPIEAPGVRRAKYTPTPMPKPPVGEIKPIVPPQQGRPAPVVTPDPLPDIAPISRRSKRNSNAIKGIVNNRRIKSVSPTGERPGKRSSTGTRGSKGRKIRN